MSWDNDFDFYEFDRDRRELGIKNSFATRDEIDARQLIELLAILDQWQENTKPARDILLAVAKVFCEFLPDPLQMYDIHLKFEKRQREDVWRESYREEIENRYHNFENESCPLWEKELLEDTARIRMAQQYQALGEQKLRPQYIDHKAQDLEILEVFARDYPALHHKFLEGVTFSYRPLNDAIQLAKSSDKLDEQERFFVTRTLEAYKEKLAEKNAPILKAEKDFNENILPLLRLKLPSIIENSRVDLAARQKARPHFAKPLTAQSEIFGRPNFCKLMATCIKAYDEAVAMGDVYAQNRAHLTMLKARAKRSTIERQFYNIDKAVEDKIARDRRWERKIERDVDRVIQQVMLQRDRYASLAYQRIRAIRQKIETGDLDSWQAANDIIAALVRANAGGKARTFSDKDKTLIQLLSERIHKTIPRSETPSSNPERTLEAFKPEREADIKADLSSQWLVWRIKELNIRIQDDYDGWLVNAGKQEKNSFYGERIDRAKPEDVKAFAHEVYGCDLEAYKNQHIETFKIPDTGHLPLEFSDRVLCDGITVNPDGTGLICPLADVGEGDMPDVDGRSVARITTYSLAFKAKSEGDVVALKNLLKQAFHFVGHTQYRYETLNLNGAYARPRPHDHDPDSRFDRYEASRAYVSFEVDGLWVSTNTRLDLDDVYKLYYVLEPAIEPNAQIAAAMNAARYAEERGAILNPDPAAFYRTRAHEVADPIGVLSHNVFETLPLAMRDIIIDLSLRKLDDANLAARLAALSQHTLSGAVRDPLGRFPSFQELLGHTQSASASKNAVMPSYQEAFDNRVYELVCTITGVAIKEAKRSPSLAFKKAVSAVGPMIRDIFRDKARMDSDSVISAFRAEEKRLREEMNDNSLQKAHARMMAGLTEDEKNDACYAAQSAEERKFEYLEYMTDILAGRTPDLMLSDEQKEALKEANKTRLVPLSNIVAGSQSAVETAIDAVHHEQMWTYGIGYHDDPTVEGANPRFYVTRTKGSPLVRKELPKALEPFVNTQQTSHTPSVTRITKALSGPRP